MATVSIVLPTCDKQQYLAYTLSILNRQTDTDFQIVIVDDNDGTSRDTVKKYVGSNQYVYLSQRNAGRAAARNAGIRSADGEVVLFLDDDRISAPDLVARHRQAQRDHSDRVVVGWKARCLTLWRREQLSLREADHLHLLRTAPELAMRMSVEDFALIEPEDLLEDPVAALSLIGLGDDFDNYPHILRRYGNDLAGFKLPWVVATTANLSVPRQMLLEVGLFDETYRGWGMEDTDLSYRLHLAGASFQVERSAVNWHQIHPIGVGTRHDLQARQNELIRNLALFCSRHATVEAYLYWRKWKGSFGLETASDVLEALDRAGSEPLRAELVETYKALLAADLATGGYETI